MKNDKEYIYALWYDNFSCPQDLIEGPEELEFYVGRTKNPEKRLKQHRYEALWGREDKYEFIRELEKNNIDWGYLILQEFDASDDTPWEYWHVIDLIRKGRPLKNMRYGDFKRDSNNQTRKLAIDNSIRNAKDLKKVIDNEESKTGAKYKSSNSLQLRAIKRSLRYRRIEIENRNGTIWKWNIFDLGEGTEEIRVQYGIKKNELASMLTPESRRIFDELARKIVFNCQ